MSDTDNSPFGFGRFVPGFDFLQSLAKGAASGVSAMPGLANWVAPTVSVEELDKRIGELKSVQFWLEQNSRALAATVQALEVQKMTLATLENMNVAMGDFAGAFGAQMTGAANVGKGSQPKAREPEPEKKPEAKAAEPVKEEAQVKADAGKSAAGASAASFMPGAAGMVDPVQWWTSLTNQFQQIAANAMRDVSQNAASAPSMAAGGGVAQDAFKAASDMATEFAAQSMKGAQEMTRSAMAAAGKTAAPTKKAPAAAKKAAPAKSAAAPAAAKRTPPKPKTGK
ncbi:hypothetical protein SDC9_82696 [bioreactor metagenome]|uniref:Uncharacterized protein n=1 Tax=bioreactor metagenome TaxID=1076179 RepID=A0A644Z7X4_9ZZZZ